MPPFQYTPFVAPDIQGIAALIAHSADPQAEAARSIAASNAQAQSAIAQAQARAAAAKGEIWGRTIQDLGQMPAQMMAQQRANADAAQRRALQQTEIVGNTQENAARDRVVQGQQLLGQLHQQYGDDYETIASKLTDAGYSKEAEDYRQSGINTAGHKQAIDQAKAKAAGSAAKDSKNFDDFMTHIDQYVLGGQFTPQERQKFVQSVQQAGPDGWNAYQKRTVDWADQVVAPKTLKEGETEFGGVSNTPLVAAPAKPVVVRPGSVGFDPVTHQPIPGMSVPATQAPVSNEWKDVLLDGKPAKVFVNPKTQVVTDLAGTVIDNPVARIKPVPPASIQVQNMVAAQTASTPVDATRPTGSEANVPDKLTGMTPNGMYQASLEYALKGTMPSIGFGQSPRAMGIRSGVINKAGAIAAAAGLDLPTVQAQYKANAATLSKLLPQAQATANASNTASDNLDLAMQQSPKVTRTDSAWVNQVANGFVRGATPAANLTKFETLIYTAAREYAKVTSGGAASVQGLTDSAAREASKLLNASQSPAAFQAAVDAMKADMGNVVSEQTKGLGRVSGTIANFFAAAQGLPVPSGPPSPAAPPVGGAPGGLTYQDYLKAKGGR